MARDSGYFCQTTLNLRQRYYFWELPGQVGFDRFRVYEDNRNTWKGKSMKKSNVVQRGLSVLVIALALLGAAGTAAAQAKKPNILVIFGDDVGYWNVSAYNQGMIGYKTPNIDRIAKEGALFTNYYGQQSCTAGRAAFITGQSPIRTGLTKVGLPGSPIGLQKQDPTLAELLKPLGYMTFQNGKNHLGDRD